jgi:alpha-tubulin suppressor-like RCC1 family protein
MTSTVITDVTQGFIYRPVIKSISMGRFHSGFITYDNRIFMTGSDYWGELGLDTAHEGKTLTEFREVLLPSGAVPQTIVCGLQMTAIIDTSNNLYFAGSNLNGKFGNGTTTKLAKFTRVTNFSGNVRQVAVSMYSDNVAVVTTSGELWVAGQNTYGQIGNGITGGTLTSFAKITINSLNATLDPVIFVALGDHSMGVITSTSTDLKSIGKPFFCGLNNQGQLGINSDSQSVNKLTQATFGSGNAFPWVRAISFGFRHCAMLSNESKLFTSGSYSVGQLGYIDWATNLFKKTFNAAVYDSANGGGDVFVKTENDCINNVRYLACGQDTTMTIANVAGDGDWRIFGCGLNDYGQLGQSPNNNNVLSKMTKVSTTPMRYLTSGAYSVLAVQNADWKTVNACGINDYGQLGFATSNSATVPFKIIETGLEKYIYPNIKAEFPSISVTPGYSKLRLNISGPASSPVWNSVGIYYGVNTTSYNKPSLTGAYPALIYKRNQASNIELSAPGIGQGTPISIQALCTSYYNPDASNNSNPAEWLPQGVSRFSSINASTMNNIPSGLSLMSGNTVIRANWTKPASNIGLTGYSLRYKPVGQAMSLVMSIDSVDTQTANITGLTPNTNYEVSIRGVDIFGVESTVVDTKTAQTLNLTPGQFTSATVADNTRITAVWTAPSGSFSNYVITLKSAANPTGVSEELPNTALTKVFSGLLQSSTYTVELRCKDSFGSFSNTVSTTLTTGSLTPTSLLTTPDTKSIAVTWTAAANTQGLTKYKVEWKTSTATTFQSAFTSNATTTSYNIVGLTPATAYSINVFGVDDGNRDSAALSIASVSTLTFSPSNIVLSACNKTIVVRWTKPTLDTFLAGYKVSWGSAASDSAIIDGKDVNYFVIPNLTNGTSYTVKVSGKDAADPPTFSPEISGTITPSNLVSTNVVKSNNRLVYTWPAVQTAQTVTYTATVTDADGIKTEKSVQATTVEFLNLDNFKEYSFEVKASVGSAAAFSWGSLAAVKPTPTAAVTPILDRLFAGNGQITVFWTGNVVNETYKIYYGTNPATLASTTPITIMYNSASMSTTSPPIGSYTVMNLDNNTTYHFALSAGNATTTETALSNTRSDVPQAALTRPDKPQGVVSTPADKSVVVSWTIAAENVNQYTIFCKTSAFASIPLDTDDGVIKRTVAGTVGTFTIPGLENGTTYYISIIAENTPLKSDMTTNLTATPRPDVPGKPVITAPQNGDAVSTISWGPVTNAVGYNVSLYPSLESTPIGIYDYVGTSQTTFTFRNLENGRMYYASVVAFNSISQIGPISDAATVQPVETTPPAVTGLTVSPARVTATLAWDTNAHGKTYEVSYYTTRSDQTTKKTVSTNTTVIEGLTANTMYNFLVTAINGQGVRGPASVTVSKRTDVEPAPAPPAAPTNVRVVSAPEALSITWTAVPTATSYIVYYSTQTINFASQNLDVSIKTVSTPSIIIPNLAAGTKYYIAIVATNNNISRSGVPSAVVEAIPAEVVPLPVPESKFVTFSKSYWWVYLIAALVLMAVGFFLWRRSRNSAQPQI